MSMPVITIIHDASQSYEATKICNLIKNKRNKDFQFILEQVLIYKERFDCNGIEKILYEIDFSDLVLIMSHDRKGLKLSSECMFLQSYAEHRCKKTKIIGVDSEMGIDEDFVRREIHIYSLIHEAESQRLTREFQNIVNSAFNQVGASAKSKYCCEDFHIKP